MVEIETERHLHQWERIFFELGVRQGGHSSTLLLVQRDRRWPLYPFYFLSHCSAGGQLWTRRYLDFAKSQLICHRLCQFLVRCGLAKMKTRPASCPFFSEEQSRPL